jgi:hypothetical protein
MTLKKIEEILWVNLEIQHSLNNTTFAYMEFREKMAAEWFSKGATALRNENIFESFIYLWIAWIIACKINFSNNGHLTKDEQYKITDSQVIEKWAKLNSSLIVESIQNNKSSLNLLANRKGTEHSNPIVDTGSKELRNDFYDFRAFIRNGYPITDAKSISVAFARLLNKIRNNLFHGSKAYSDEKDRDLLNAILPTLMEIVERETNRLIP